MAQTTFEERLTQAYTRILYFGIPREAAIAEIKAAVLLEIPEKMRGAATEKAVEFLHGYNQAIKEITEKIK